MTFRKKKIHSQYLVGVPIKGIRTSVWCDLEAVSRGTAEPLWKSRLLQKQPSAHLYSWLVCLCSPQASWPANQAQRDYSQQSRGTSLEPWAVAKSLLEKRRLRSTRLHDETMKISEISHLLPRFDKIRSTWLYASVLKSNSWRYNPGFLSP